MHQGLPLRSRLAQRRQCFPLSIPGPMPRSAAEQVTQPQRKELFLTDASFVFLQWGLEVFLFNFAATVGFGLLSHKGESFAPWTIPIRGMQNPIYTELMWLRAGLVQYPHSALRNVFNRT